MADFVVIIKTTGALDIVNRTKSEEKNLTSF